MDFHVETVADSLSPFMTRLTSFEIVFPRIILAEFNTHRMFSRNSASSRAIPYPKMVRSVLKNPFIPIKWMKDHSGMQGTEYHSSEDTFKFKDVNIYLFERFKLKEEDEDYQTIRSILERISMRPEFSGVKTLTGWWLTIRDLIVDCSTLLYCFNVSKQICNRLLEAFMWHKVIVSSTEWENFFAQRADPNAEIHMEKLAVLMLEALNQSTPKRLQGGQWHIPYADHINLEELETLARDWNGPFLAASLEERMNLLKVKISTARCARTSYTTIGQKGKPYDLVADIALHDRLSQLHYTPFEHPARVMNSNEWEDAITAGASKHSIDDARVEHGWCGNYQGFIQYRKFFQGENQKDRRVLKAYIPELQF